jgi:iron complex transport system ATP-binding protein
MGTIRMSALLQCTGLGVGYRKTRVLGALSMELVQGEMVSLLGVNGSGKSTFLRTLAGLQPPLEGEVLLAGRPVHQMPAHERARLLSVVLTGRPAMGLLDVHTLVSLGRQPWTDHLGRLGREDREKVQLAMDRTGTTAFASRAVSTLSDGELQKVLVARALAQDTPLMLLDEPTAFLDLVNRVQVMRLLRKIAGEMGKTVLLSTHDLQTAMTSSDRLLILDNGSLWSGTPKEAVEKGVLARAFSPVGTRFDPVTMSFI